MKTMNWSPCMAAVTAPPYERVGQRVEDNARALVLTHPFLSTFVIKERDSDLLIVPENEIPRPVIIIVARDMGRYHRRLPIRNIRLSFAIRANSKTPGGSAESFSAIGGALEIFLDTTNLVQALSSATVGVMLATRQEGIEIRFSSLIRQGTMHIDCKAVAAELTTSGTSVLTGS